jgi:molybdopterin molybdotransferase
MESPNMIELEEASTLLFENIHTIGIEERRIEEAVGCALAEDIASSIDVSPFRNSAMDGFAVTSSWLADCSNENPLSLPYSRTIFAGDSVVPADAGEEPVKVMTGARVPDGYDAVVPIEDAEYDGKTVRFFNPVAPGRHVREAGEDISRGQLLFKRGSVLSRLDIGILATIGLPSVQTYRKPSLVVIGTGNELVDPGETLPEGKIYDSNSYTIAALASPYCGEVECIHRVPDRQEELRKVLASQHDVIVTTGGVSVGDRDYVVEMAESSGWRRIFHTVHIKPGKPVYFAVRGKQVLLGLPGNALSSTVTCCLFLIPALKKMSGFAQYRLQRDSVFLTPEEFRKCKRLLIWPGSIHEENGRKLARYSPKTSSAALTALKDTHGLIIQNCKKPESEDARVDFISWSQILL